MRTFWLVTFSETLKSNSTHSLGEKKTLRSVYAFNFTAYGQIWAVQSFKMCIHFKTGLSNLQYIEYYMDDIITD